MRSRWTSNTTKEEFCMKNVFMISPSRWVLALALVSLSAACSDNSGQTTPVDASKADGAVGGGGPETGARDTRVADIGTPDQFVVETGGVEAQGADLRPSDAAVADQAQADAPASDTIVVNAADAPVDAPAIDTRPVNLDVPRVDSPGVDRATVDSAAADSPGVDGAAVDGGASLVARGKYLVDHVIACSDCHTPKTNTGAPDMTKYLAGNATFVQLPSGDALPTRNLTPDKATGLGSYTATQIKHMFMDGLVPGDGGTMALNPVMPYYVFHNMAVQDADAIVAYLQSIPAVNNPLPNRSAAFDVSAPANYLDPAVIPTPADSYPQKDSALRGRYLATESGLCIECHTKHLPSGPNTLDTSKFFQGGEDFSSFFAGTLNIHPVSANLTSDPTTGLGGWTAAQIVTVLHQGKDDHGDGICPPMPAGPNGAYGGLSDQDAQDIANYILSLPPAVNDVPDNCTFPPPPPAVDGGSVDGSGVDGSGIDSSTSG
jgi:mono/diheme cytochrome c family protein